MIHGRFSDIGQANWIVVDICRLQEGVLVEHWDVIQDEVGQAAPAGGHPMFGGAFPPGTSPAASITGQGLALPGRPTLTRPKPEELIAKGRSVLMRLPSAEKLAFLGLILTKHGRVSNCQSA